MVGGNKALSMCAIARHRLPVCSTPICSRRTITFAPATAQKSYFYRTTAGTALGIWRFTISYLFLKFIIVYFPAIKIIIIIILHEKLPSNESMASHVRIFVFTFHSFMAEQNECRCRCRCTSQSSSINFIGVIYLCTIFQIAIRPSI